ncbi:BQ2448_1975 [Microbotryum intermedium]|uniref:BQ2448_1975 protein n=1 Tax=Microbotryum intermedium TaxID=269621 RepID=A0A238F6Y9_9BASI|nr:BQ2448_1975 [Microbotryum intermedium]
MGLIQEELLFNKNTASAIQAARVTLAGLPTTIVDVPRSQREGRMSLVTQDVSLSRLLCSNQSLEAFVTRRKISFPPNSTRVFNLDVAKTCLAFSSLVYMRNERFVKKAFDRDQTIREQTLKWDLNYESISNLGSPQGAFESVFDTKVGASQPSMMLVFKGTTPANYSEFIVDCMLTCIDATTLLGGGTVHEGFATQLFPMFGVPGVSARDGYGQMTYQLKRIAKQLLAHHSYLDAIPLWMSGHSLGAALASLVFARALRAPEDLGPHIQLRDCYTFGGPRTGDAIFAALVGSEMIKPINRPNILWRV